MSEKIKDEIKNMKAKDIIDIVDGICSLSMADEIQSLKQQLVDAERVVGEADEYLEADGSISAQVLYECLEEYKSKYKAGEKLIKTFSCEECQHWHDKLFDVKTYQNSISE